MTLHALTTIALLEEFLVGTQPVAFSVLRTKDDCHQWILTSLITFEYLTLSKPLKGLLRGCKENCVTGYHESFIHME